MDDQLLRDMLSNLFEKTESLGERMAAHIAREEMRDDAQAEVLRGILAEMQKVNTLINRGKGAGAVIFTIAAALAVLAPSVIDHFWSK